MAGGEARPSGRRWKATKGSSFVRNSRQAVCAGSAGQLRFIVEASYGTAHLPMGLVGTHTRRLAGECLIGQYEALVSHTSNAKKVVRGGLARSVRVVDWEQKVCLRPAGARRESGQLEGFKKGTRVPERMRCWRERADDVDSAKRGIPRGFVTFVPWDPDTL